MKTLDFKVCVSVCVLFLFYPKKKVQKDKVQNIIYGPFKDVY